MRFIFRGFSLLAAGVALGFSLDGAARTIVRDGYKIDPDDRSCGGLPRVQIETMSGFCVGLAASASDGLKFPRTVVPLPGSRDVLVVDMGGWAPGAGNVFRLHHDGDGYSVDPIITGLKLPHGSAIGPDGKVYVGEQHQIFRFDADSPDDREVILAGLPTITDGPNNRNKHPLKEFIFLGNGDLLLNIGAPTDSCEDSQPRVCRATETAAQLRVYHYDRASNSWDENFTVLARGLRNSVALVQHPSGTILQGENSRDFPDKDRPYEELNVIKEGRHYGWPYCYDFTGKSPEFSSMRFNCTPGETFDDSGAIYEAPHILMPPHVSPLSMLYYNGDMFREELGGKLIMTWHGHEGTGHRLVAYQVDARGVPVLDFDASAPGSPEFRDNVTFTIDGEARARPYYHFADRSGASVASPGKFLRGAQHLEVVHSMYKSPGVRPRGQMVGIAVDGEGAIWAAADKESNAVLRIARGNVNSVPDNPPEEDEGGVYARGLRLLRENNAPEYETILAKFGGIFEQSIHKSCAGCHGIPLANSATELERSALGAIFQDFVGSAAWLTPGNSQRSQLLTRALSHFGDRMPPAGSHNPDISGEVAVRDIVPFINDMTNHFANTGVHMAATAVKVRSGPVVAASTDCGMALDPGDLVYVHETRENGSTLWARVNLERKRAADLPDRCGTGSVQQLFVAVRSLSGSQVYLEEIGPATFRDQ